VEVPWLGVQRGGGAKGKRKDFLDELPRNGLRFVPPDAPSAEYDGVEIHGNSSKPLARLGKSLVVTLAEPKSR
jgi:hypothetical protein